MFSVSTRFGAICERNRPSFSPKRRCGPMTASVFASRLGMLTALRMVPSSSSARIDCAISMPTLSCASAVDAPKWGVRIRLGAVRNGESAGNGSVSKTSSAAAATHRSSNALMSAASSIRPPRAQFTMRTPRFVFCKRAALRICRVSGVSGVCNEMKSACVSKSSSSSTSSTCKLRARVAERYGS